MNDDVGHYLQNAQAQMRKGILEFCILSLIAKRKSVYASDILTALKAEELIVMEGTLYPLLTRLRGEGLLDYTWQESRSGPPRKYYKLTARGGKALTELEKTWTALQKTLNTFTA